MMFRALDPRFRPWAQWIYDTAQLNGLSPRITSTYRSMATQQRLYDNYRAGRSKYPAAPPGRSWHNYGLALDMVADRLPELGRLWQSVGGGWGGNADPVHFGLRGSPR